MKNIFLILITFYSYVCFSQNTDFNDIRTKKQNIEWITEIENLSLREQIEQIKIRIELDEKLLNQTKYLNIGNHIIGDRLIYVNEKKLNNDRLNSNYECKVGFFLNFKKDSFILDLNNKYTAQIMRLLNIDNINKIYFDKNLNSYTDEKVRHCGLVLIETNNKQIKNIIKNML